MSKHQAHRKVRDYNLHAGFAELFKPGRHYATHLAEKVILFSKLRGEQLGRLQKLALHRFHRDIIFDLRPEVTNVPDTEVLAAYFQFLDELFFFGSLVGSKRFLLEVESRLVEGGPRGNFSKLSLLNAQDGTLSQIYKLRIFPQRGENRYHRLRKALGFMLRGMCHTFLKLWRCKSGHCNETWGEDGAGWAWQDMALAIDDALSDRHFVNLDIPIDRIEVLADTLKKHPTFMNDEQLRKWRIDPKRLARMAGKNHR